jgi:hypothetical protein
LRLENAELIPRFSQLPESLSMLLKGSEIDWKKIGGSKSGKPTPSARRRTHFKRSS